MYPKKSRVVVSTRPRGSKKKLASVVITEITGESVRLLLMCTEMCKDESPLKLCSLNLNFKAMHGMQASLEDTTGHLNGCKYM